MFLLLKMLSLHLCMIVLKLQIPFAMKPGHLIVPNFGLGFSIGKISNRKLWLCMKFCHSHFSKIACTILLCVSIWHTVEMILKKQHEFWIKLKFQICF